MIITNKLLFPGLLALAPQMTWALFNIGGGYNDRGEHCNGICDVVEYNCELKEQAKITPSDIAQRDKGKLPRETTKGYSVDQMRAYCIKSCFHKDPWKQYKSNPQQYFSQFLCKPTSAVRQAEEKLKQQEALYNKPVLGENRTFTYRYTSSNAINATYLKKMDRKFLVDKEKNAGLKAAVNTIEMINLVLAGLVGAKVESMSEDQKQKTARDLVSKELSFSPQDQKQYEEQGTASLDALARVLESTKDKIFKIKKFNPKEIP